ncbi:unnamed protein product [Prunus armeniaca]
MDIQQDKNGVTSLSRLLMAFPNKVIGLVLYSAETQEILSDLAAKFSVDTFSDEKRDGRGKKCYKITGVL